MKKFFKWLIEVEEKPIDKKITSLKIEIKNAKFCVNGHTLEPGNFLQNATVQNFINSQKKEDKKTFSFKERAEEIKKKYNHKFFITFKI